MHVTFCKIIYTTSPPVHIVIVHRLLAIDRNDEMINVLVYNHFAGVMDKYSLQLYSPMPYSSGTTLSVGEFRGKSNSNIVWTDSRAMLAWNATRAAWGQPISVGYSFRRIGEGGHSNQSQHYAGTAFDVAQNLSNTSRNLLRNVATQQGVWSYVEPAYLTPTWVHFDARLGPPACSAGYPLLRQGSKGVYVATLQDALSTVGIPAVGIDGIFGPNTYNAVASFQRSNGLLADGIAGCQTWTKLTAMTNGIWRRSPAIPLEYACD